MKKFIIDNKLLNFKEQYQNLKQNIIFALEDKIKKSTYTSKHIEDKAIIVNIFNYTELAIINNTLIFLDENGLHYSLFNNCNLEDLINIIDTC